MKIVVCEIRSGIISVKQRSSLGVQWCASHLQANGFPDVCSILFEAVPFHEKIRVLSELQFDVLVLEFRSRNRQEAYGVINALKERNPSFRLIVIGHDISLHAARFMNENKHIDYVAYGEAEKTVLELCECIRDKKSVETCAGIFYRMDDLIFRNDARQIQDDLNHLICPSLDIPKAQFLRKGQDTVFVSTRTARGCLGKCAFCSLNRLTSISGHAQWRGRDLNLVIDELQYIQKEFPGKRLVVEFVDNSFEDPYPKDKRRIHELMELIEQSNLTIAFAILTRTESWSDDDDALIRRMKKNGLYYVAPGIETNTAEGLKRLNKRGTVESNQRIMDVFGKHSVAVHPYLIMFYPYTTLPELQANADYLNKNMMTAYPFNWQHSMELHPETEMFRQASRDGLITCYNDETCTHEYLFADGYVHQIFSLMKNISDPVLYANYMNIYEVTRFEQYLFEVWKTQYEQMAAIESIMQEYGDAYRTILQQIGLRFYDVFSTILSCVATSNFASRKKEFTDSWNIILKEGHDSLRSIWIKNNMTLLRKKIKLL